MLFSRIKFAFFSVAKNAPRNARRCDSHGLKLRRICLLCSVCHFFAGSTAPMPEITAEQLVQFSSWTAQLSGTLDDFHKQFRRRLPPEACDYLKMGSGVRRTAVKTNTDEVAGSYHRRQSSERTRLCASIPFIVFTENLRGVSTTLFFNREYDSPVRVIGELRMLRGIPRWSVAFWGRDLSR